MSQRRFKNLAFRQAIQGVNQTTTTSWLETMAVAQVDAKVVVNGSLSTGKMTRLFDPCVSFFFKHVEHHTHQEVKT